MTCILIKRGIVDTRPSFREDAREHGAGRPHAWGGRGPRKEPPADAVISASGPVSQKPGLRCVVMAEPGTQHRFLSAGPGLEPGPQRPACWCLQAGGTRGSLCKVAPTPREAQGRRGVGEGSAGGRRGGGGRGRAAAAPSLPPKRLVSSPWYPWSSCHESPMSK